MTRRTGGRVYGGDVALRVNPCTPEQTHTTQNVRLQTEARTHDRPSRRAAALRRAIEARFELKPWENELLRQALEALDTAEAARAAIGSDLVVVDSRGGSKANPLLVVERDARASFARIMRQLGLESDIRSLSGPSSFPRKQVVA